MMFVLPVEPGTFGSGGSAKTGIVDGPLPQALAATPYARSGDLAFVIALAVILMIAMGATFTRAKTRN